MLRAARAEAAEYNRECLASLHPCQGGADEFAGLVPQRGRGRIGFDLWSGDDDVELGHSTRGGLLNAAHAGDPEWRAAAFFLERCRHAEWGRWRLGRPKREAVASR